MKAILITGIGGFLGRHIARHFVANGWQVTGIDALADPQLGTNIRYTQLALPSPALPDFLVRARPDVCIHCAGSASVPLSMSDPANDFRANVGLTFEMLDALRQHAPKCRFILLSSAAVYGNPKTLPIDEKQHLAPMSPYGFHKRQCELLCQEFSRIYDLPTVSARIFSAYGPGLRKQVVWDICERLLTKGALSLKGTGRESRDFIHPADIAAALALLAEKAPADGEIYNVASGRETTIAYLAALLASTLGVDATAKFDGEVRAGDPLNWRADIGRIAALGFAPGVTLEAGIAEAAQWVRRNADNPVRCAGK